MKKGQIEIYQTGDGTNIQVKLEQDTVWLSQAQMAELFDKDVRTINEHIQTIYKTGVEVEAMHGASVVALNMYDMLKPLDKGVEIKNIKLLKKTGGKSDYTAKL